MTETTEFGRGRRTSLLDRTWRDHWSVLMLSPIKAPTVAELRSKMLEFMAENPRHPLSCTLEDGGKRWRPVAVGDRERHVEEAIVPGESFDVEHPFDYIDGNRPAGPSTAPYKVVVGADSMVMYFDHVVGDIAAFAPFAVLMSLGDVHGLKGLAADAGLPVATKIFLKEVRPHWRDWWQHARTKAVTAPVAVGAQHAIAHRAPTTTGRFVVVSAEEFGAFKAWRKSTCPDIATTALMASATFVALEREGVPLNDKGFYTLVDLRRHLPKKQALRPGNLAKSAYIDADMRDPAAVGEGVRQLIESTRAVPALVAGAVSAGLRKSTRETAAAHLEPVTMTFNSMMRIPGIAHIPWTRPSEAYFVATSYHVGVNGLSVSACAVEGGMCIAASFDPTRVDPDVVARALGHLRDMPALLEARLPAAPLKLVDH
ncbi:hypothetical protein D8S82_12030 [Mycobacterium hodleri]|uniref:Diacylglycerol O-acyltransferase n=1 Tax=Mycolicibacterium hodleri TaxID=49897 RepID=A0A544W232_9MYCO|nr:hypothetical protein [Mycolicibacterium hodleri]TQR86305.1 hypothetical protein D8S82_12030 [Mycolicibacterium hodleri]